MKENKATKNQLDNQHSFDLEKCIIEINIAKDKIEENIINIGEWLTIAKNLVKHGEWENWLESNVGYTKMTASRYMKAYNLLNIVPKEIEHKIENLGGTKVIELSTLKVEQVEEIITNNNVETMSVRELKEIVKEFKQANKKSKESKSNIDVTFENTKNEIIEISKELIVSEVVDVEKVVRDTIILNQSLKNRANSEETIEITLVARYNAKEITFMEMMNTVAQMKYNLPVFFNKQLLDEYLDRFDNHFYSNYQQYDSNTDKKEDRTYYSLFDRDLEWQEVIKCWDDKDEGSIDWSKGNNVDNNIYQLSKSYLEDTIYLCIYKDYKLQGVFIDGGIEDIKQLCIYDNTLDYKALNILYVKLQKQIKSYEKRQSKRDEEEKIARKIRQDKRKKYEDALNVWKNVYQPYSMGQYKFEDIWDNCGEVYNYKLWREMCNFVDSQRKTQQDRWSGVFGDSKLVIKEEDKPMYKKIYKTLALNYHPDKGGTLEDMQFVNKLKENWGI